MVYVRRLSTVLLRGKDCLRVAQGKELNQFGIQFVLGNTHDTCVERGASASQEILGGA